VADPDAPATRPAPSAARRLLSLSTAYRYSQLVYVAAKLDIAEQLADRPLGCDELAARVGASPGALLRVMRGLVMLGVFDQIEDGRFALTELSLPLRSGVSGSIRAGVIFWGQEQYRAWGDLLHTVTTGEPAFRRLFGNPFDYYDQHPATDEVFETFMTIASLQVAGAVAANYEFPDSGLVVDVGGGEGVLLAAILESRPRLRGVLIERQTVVEKARRRFEAEGLSGRCRVVAGDFRETVPAGGDVYVLKNVLHNWDDSTAVAILTACRRAMKRGARIVVLQRAMPDAASPAPSTQQVIEDDLMEMVYTGGMERTLDQYRALFAAAGLRIHATMASGGATWLMDARRVHQRQAAHATEVAT
jgi:ubiquinone/menaquinone biosynthesis C-methylase UbiE